MAINDIINEDQSPVTLDILKRDLEQLGVRAGSTLLVHTSLSRIGYVSGGAESVTEALIDSLGPDGTLVMPAFSSETSDPRYWTMPPIPAAWHQIVRDTMPAFDRRKTWTRGVGRTPELFRTWPNVRRSNHPQTSFAALGPLADDITSDHRLEISLGEDSPLAELYDIGANVLLLGAGFGSCTCFHLSEVRSNRGSTLMQGSPIFQDGKRRWVEFRELDYDDRDFEDIGSAFEKTGDVRRGNVGYALSRLFSLKRAVDFATHKMAP